MQRSFKPSWNHRLPAIFSVWSIQITSSCYAWCFSSSSSSYYQLTRRNLSSIRQAPQTGSIINHRLAAAAATWTAPGNTAATWRSSLSSLSSSSSSHADGEKESASSSSTTYTRHYLATCIPGLATVLAQELVQLGAMEVVPSGTSAVQFEATPLIALRILLWVRTAHKILEFLVSSDNDDETSMPLSTPDDLYQFIQRSIQVKDLLGDGQGGLLTLAVSVQFNNVQNIPTDLNHSHFTALTIKNALVDRVRDLRGDGTRPDVDIDTPQVPLVAILRGIPTTTTTMMTTMTSSGWGNNANNNRPAATAAAAHLSLYRCLHPPMSLHKRGYRSGGAIHKAALKESLAAGLLLYAGWDKICKAAITTTDATTTSHDDDDANDPSISYLIDPMAGSGSLVIEAAMIGADLAPGLVRIKCKVPGFVTPPVLYWKYPGTTNMAMREEWKQLLRDATYRAQRGIQELYDSPSVQIHANDIHPGALDLLRQSLQQAGLDQVVQVHCGDCQDLKIHPQNHQDSDADSNSKSSTLVVTNPPWGVRLEENHIQSWDSLRKFLRDVCPSDATEAWVLCGNKDATRHLALKKTQSLRIQTGEHDLRWIQYLIRSKAAVEATETAATLEAVPLQAEHEHATRIRKDKPRERLNRNTENIKRLTRRVTKSNVVKGQDTGDSWFIN